MELKDYSTKALLFVSAQGSLNADLTHAALGITSDMGELIECLAEFVIEKQEINKVNLIEECGDIYWFCNLAASCVGLDFEGVHNAAKDWKDHMDDMDMNELILWLAIGACRLADRIKAHVIYGKELDANGMMRELGAVLRTVEELAGRWDVTLPQVLEANIAKLTTRYGAKFDKVRALRRDTIAEAAAMYDAAGRPAP